MTEDPVRAAAIGAGEATVEALRRKTEAYQFLADAAMRLAGMSTFDEVFAFIRASVPALLPGLVTFVGRTSPDGDGVELVDIQGLDGSLLARGFKALGFNPVGRRFAIVPRFRELYENTRLHRHDAGLVDLTDGVLPAPVARAIEAIVGIRELFTIAFAEGPRLFGTLIVLVTRQGRTVDESVVEPFVYQCFNAFSRIESRQGLEESERRLREMAGAIRSAFWLTDATTGQILYVSPGYETVFGRSCEDLCRDPASFLECVHADDVDRVSAGWAAHGQRATGIDEEFRIVRPDGATRWIRARGFPLLDETGHAVRIAGIADDITDRKSAERAVIEMERRLFDAQKLESLGILAGGIAHDFNNLLAAVLGNLDVALQDIPPSQPARGPLEQAVESSRRAVDLTRQMLAYSGRGRFVVRQVNLGTLLQENAHLFRAAVPRTVTMTLDIDPDVPTIAADPGQLQQVVMNLITNAAEAVGEGPGVVTLSVGARVCSAAELARSRIETAATPGIFVHIVVTDTGCGMDHETERRLFDPFFTTKFAGRGLGMAVVLGIVRSQHGAVIVDTSVGAGTTVRVMLPVGAAEAVGAVRQVEAAQATRSAPTQAPLAGTVLVADDDPAVLGMCRKMLERLGLSVVAACDGQEAIEAFGRQSGGISCVILDLTMPRVDGARALRAIKAIRPDVPVLLSSGFGEEPIVERFAGEELAGFIQKPYGFRALREAVTRALGSPGAAEA